MLLLSPNTAHNLFVKIPLPTPFALPRPRRLSALAATQNLGFTLPPSLQWLWSLPTASHHSHPQFPSSTAFQAVLFDLEGVIIENLDPDFDSLAWLILSQEQRKQFIPPSVLSSIENITSHEAIYNVLEWSEVPAEIRRLSARKEEIFRCLVTGSYRIRQGTREFLDVLARDGIRLGIISTRSREFVEEVIREVGLDGLFECVVAGEDVELGMPSSELFVAAAGVLELEGKQCAVFGNSDETVMAADRAGMRSIGVAGKMHVYEFRSGVRVVRWLSDVSIRDLERLVLDDPIRKRASEWSMEIEECHSI